MSPHHFRPATASPFRSKRFSIALEILGLFVVLNTSQLLFGIQPPRTMIPQGKRLSVSTSLATATTGVAYSSVVSVSGGTPPYQFSQQDLPSGLALNPQTGVIAGTPKTAGQFPFEIFVTDSKNNRGWARPTLTVTTQAGVGITVTPTSASVNSGATAQFQATVSNTSNTAVTWSATKGTVSSSGLFTAPTVTASTTVVLTATSAADSTKTATANISVAPATTASNVALEVLFPPTNPNSQDFKALQTYVMSNPIVSGGNLTVEWGMIDNGPTANPQYDWSALDSEILPWTAAGKKVNLIVWANSDSTTTTCSNGQTSTTGNCAIPAYIWTALGPSNYTTCDTQYGTQRMPNYLDRTNFQLPYQQFLTAVVEKYGSDSRIGYIRFGLGHGGETYTVAGWNDNTTACGKAFAAWGVTITSWETYLAGMLNYESSLHSSKQLMVGVTPMGVPTTQVPDFVAPLAVPMHVGFGSQGLQQSDITGYPDCTGDWCNLFAQFNGQAPLELQTVGQSDPTGAGATGSLVALVPFAVSHHASVLEIYYQDWLLAFDPAYPGYSQYGAAYAQVLTQAAKTQVK